MERAVADLLGRGSVVVGADGGVDQVGIHLGTESEAFDGVEVQIAVGYHIGAVTLTGVKVVGKRVDEGIHIVGGGERIGHHLWPDDVLVGYVVIMAIGTTQLHPGGGGVLVR